MTPRPREQGYYPPTSYETVTEYEPYPDQPADLPYQVPYEPEYPQQTIAAMPPRERETTIPQAVRHLVRNATTFHGREDRATFWLGALGIVGSLAVAAILAMTMVLMLGFGLGSAVAGPMVVLSAALLGLGGLGGLVTLLSGGVRRLHDTGLPGWLLALWFIPFGWVAVLVLLARPGQPRRNGFGPDPAAR